MTGVQTCALPIYHGVIVHFDSQRWPATEVLETPVRLKGIGGRSASEVWAVGGTPDNHAVIYRFDGERWAQVKPHADERAESSWLQAVWGGADRVWFVGDNGTILSYAGQRWFTSAATQHKVNFRAIWGRAPDALWAAGTDGAIFRAAPSLRPPSP